MTFFLNHYGYGSLFILSFLAATIIPIGSEWLLLAMVYAGFDPVTAVAVATSGNTLGACTTYGIGLYGGPWMIQKAFRMDETDRKRAEIWYARYGIWSLLFSWVPVVGDPICLVGGMLGIRFGVFVLLVTVGKMFRYGLLTLLVY
jgi:membrane protein YqaA with SNARE-associated domain